MVPSLSQTGLYADIAAKHIAARVLHYSPQFPLWSDGAKKVRWILLPDGTTIDTSDQDHWTFPVGTKFWKEFSFNNHRVETRLMEKTSATKWAFASYLWNDSETDATLAPDTGKKDYYPITATVKHDIPAGAQCIQCHSRGGDRVLGFEALQLSDDREPTAEPLLPEMVTLKTLATAGLISHPPATPPRVLAVNELGRRAQGYLHANCGSCHNPRGSANNTTITFRYPVATATPADSPAIATSLNQDADSPDGWKRLIAGDPDHSAIVYRMRRPETALHMPRIGTKITDAGGVQLISDWVKGL